ncbi:hypothetical protein BDV10DRAFT_185146 [Aspergillus recurvatus]
MSTNIPGARTVSSPSKALFQSQPAAVRNPVWLFYDASRTLPSAGRRVQGLSEVSPGGLVFPASGPAIGEGTLLPRVVLVVPKPAATTSDDMSATSSGSSFVALSLAELVEKSKKDDKPAPEVGSEAEGLWGTGETFLQFGRGKVVAVLEDVVVFTVSRPGGAVHPGYAA